jgi:tetratricopeptide (TPR) repeat protein
MADHLFVARERELAKLDAMLQKALAGETQIGFVIGEAGTGKTTLVQEFAHRAEDADPTLVIAVGNCNAQTGGGDPYLPFREILAQLTGDIEGKLAQKEISAKNANRLKGFLRASGATLLQFGPDLIGTFVPGASLAARAATYAAGELGLTDALKKEADKKAGGSELEQNKILEQYAGVLAALAKQQPLLLILDDLQWADNASINLLFHLTRQLPDSRIFLLGAYRPDDVAVGRGNDRHPLEPVVNEIRRYHGDVLINLSEAVETEGRRFVDAILDQEPNTLDEAFRQALFAHTDGHPLFTVELIRDMQESGALVRDSAGRWEVSPDLDWENLPARVEGVIDERIRRLPDDLRDVLAAASVEGPLFTPRVLSRLQGIPERQLLKTLARELGKRHRLVEEAGEVKVRREFITRYRFAHLPIQQFVYNDLSLGERRLLHREIAAVLEGLYEGRTDAVIVQLAQHYAQAGLTEKAIEYLGRAGQRAYQLSAFAEATRFYEDALALATEPEDRPARMALTRQLGYVHLGLSALAPAKARLEESLALARELDDRQGRAAALSGLGRVATEQGAYGEAKTRLEESLPLAREIGDKAGLVPVLKDLGMATGWLGFYDDALAYLTESLALAREVGDGDGIVSALNHLGHIAQDKGAFADARTYLEESLTLARESGNRVSTTVALFNLAIIDSRLGNLAEATAHAQEALTLAREVGNKSLIAGALSQLGMIAANQGPAERRAAEPYLHEALTIAQESGAVPFALYALFGYAMLRAREGLLVPAVELLGLILHHPGIISGVKEVAEPLLHELEGKLPPDAVSAALARGQTWPLDAVARQFLAQPAVVGGRQ